MSSAQLRARGSPLWKQREREEREAAKTVDPKDRFFTDDYGAGDTPEAKLPKAKSRKRAKKTKDSIDPPEWLTGPARALWTELGQQLIDADVLDIDQDLVAFSMMCRCYGDHLAALEIVD